MVLGKITVDKSLRYIRKSEQTKERDIKPSTIKAGSLPRKQNKNVSQNNERFFNRISTSGFGIIK